MSNPTKVRQIVLDKYGIDPNRLPKWKLENFVDSDTIQEIKEMKKDPKNPDQQVTDEEILNERYKDSAVVNRIKSKLNQKMSLEEAMNGYYNNINKTLNTGDVFLNARPPKGAFNTFPLIDKSDANSNRKKEVDYMTSYLKLVANNVPKDAVGPELMDTILNNETYTTIKDENGKEKTVSIQLYQLEEEINRIAEEAKNAEKEAKEREKRIRRAPQLPEPVVKAAIYIDTSEKGFAKANFDAKQLIISTANFNADPPTVRTVNNYNTHRTPHEYKVQADSPGWELQQYHNSLLARAQSKLNRLASHQQAINGHRIRHIKREWKHFAAMFTMDPTRMPPGYNPMPPSNEWITNNNSAFLSLSRAELQNMVKNGLSNADYLLFDSTLKDNTAGYEAWVIWAEPERKKYAKLCLNWFVKPNDISWEDVPNPIVAGPEVRYDKIQNRFANLPKRRRLNPSPPPNVAATPNTFPPSPPSPDSNAETVQQSPVGMDVDDNSTDDDEQQVEEDYGNSTDDELQNQQQSPVPSPQNPTSQQSPVQTQSPVSSPQNPNPTSQQSPVQTQSPVPTGSPVQTQSPVPTGSPVQTPTSTGSNLSLASPVDSVASTPTSSPLVGESPEEKMKRTRVITIKEKHEKTNQGGIRYDYVDEKGKEGYLRIEPKSEKAYFNFIMEFDEALKNDPEKYKHLMPVELGTDGNKENVATVSTDTTIQFNETTQIDFGSYEVINGYDGSGKPKMATGLDELTLKDSFMYLQLKQGKPLINWVEDQYLQFKEDDNGITEKNQDGLKKVTGVAKLLSSPQDDRTSRLQDKIMKIIDQTYRAVNQFNSIDKGQFVHRDVKLDNVTWDDDTETLRLFDYDVVVDASLIPKGAKVTTPQRNGTALMDRWNTNSRKSTTEGSSKDLNALFKDPQKRKWLDYHQAGMMLLQLGGMFDWVGEYDWSELSNELNERASPTRRPFATFSPENDANAFLYTPVDNFWEHVLLGTKQEPSMEFQRIVPSGTSNKGKLRSTKDRSNRSNAWINKLRKLDPTEAVEIFNMKSDAVHKIGKKFFRLTTMIVDEPYVPTPLNTPRDNKLQSAKPYSPMQFISELRQPVFERVTIESDYGDDLDLEALMEFDPDLNGELENNSPSSHISDEDFERMLNETSYDALSEHIMKENQSYSDNSVELEEDAKSTSSKHSNVSDVSVASQMSNMSASSDISVASNLSAASDKSNMSDMSNHSYASNHSMESEEAYPTSEQSYGHVSEQSYNQTSSYNNSSSEGSGKELGYNNGMSESSDHGMSESSDVESESMGYSSGSSRQHSYNSNSETE